MCQSQSEVSFQTPQHQRNSHLSESDYFLLLRIVLKIASPIDTYLVIADRHCGGGNHSQPEEKFVQPKNMRPWFLVAVMMNDRVKRRKKFTLTSCEVWYHKSSRKYADRSGFPSFLPIFLRGRPQINRKPLLWVRNTHRYLNFFPDPLLCASYVVFFFSKKISWGCYPT